VYSTYEAMKEFGHFDKGVYHRNEGVEGKKAMDSFQATWEFANKRPLEYPTPQYADPLIMNTEHYRWMPLDGAPGVAEKAYGTFTDCTIRSSSYKLSPGSTLKATGRGIYFVLSGNGTIEAEPFRRYTGVYLETGESTSFHAEKTSEILLLGLPEVARMKKPLPSATATTATVPA
jgi:hypothetical protein